MTPTGEPLVERFEAALPARYRGIGGMPMLDEVERAARLQYASQLLERVGQIGNRAQRPGREHRIERLGRQVQLLAVEPGQLHRGRRPGDAGFGDPHADGRRFDRQDLRDLGWVVRNVESGAEPDLDDIAA